MKTFNRKLMAVAMATALASPLAFAQLAPVAGATGQATSTATAQVGTNATAPTLPTKTAAAATDAQVRKTAPPPTKKVASDAKMRDDTKIAGAASSDSSAGTNPGKGNWWNDADTDGDGKLSLAESAANAGLNSRFADIDTDKDGFVTNEEYRKFYTSQASQGETHAAAGSAVVSRDIWLKLDADADSRISLSEAAGNASLASSFSAIDSNNDGFVTQAEYSAYARMK